MKYYPLLNNLLVAENNIQANQWYLHLSVSQNRVYYKCKAACYQIVFLFRRNNMWVETMTIVFRVPEERFVLFTKISIFQNQYLSLDTNIDHQ